MQKEEKIKERTVPLQLWEDLEKCAPVDLCPRSLAVLQPDRTLLIRILDKDVIIDVENRSLYELDGHEKKKINHPFWELILLVYLNSVSTTPFANEMINHSQLKDAIFFQGSHELPKGTLLDKFGSDFKAFETAAQKIGGSALPGSDNGFRFTVFPRIPLYIMLWAKDWEFEGRISILFDRSIDFHLPADGIFGLCHLVAETLIQEDADIFR